MISVRYMTPQEGEDLRPRIAGLATRRLQDYSGLLRSLATRRS